jgi:hypothetical protein
MLNVAHNYFQTGSHKILPHRIAWVSHKFVWFHTNYHRICAHLVTQELHKICDYSFVLCVLECVLFLAHTIKCVEFELLGALLSLSCKKIRYWLCLQNTECEATVYLISLTLHPCLNIRNSLQFRVKRICDHSKITKLSVISFFSPILRKYASNCNS